MKAQDYNDDNVADAPTTRFGAQYPGQAVGLGSSADGNRDGTITTADYGIWKANFGKHLIEPSGSASLAKVPEPGTVCLSLIPAFSLASSFRRRPCPARY